MSETYAKNQSSAVQNTAQQVFSWTQNAANQHRSQRTWIHLVCTFTMNISEPEIHRNPINKHASTGSLDPSGWASCSVQSAGQSIKSAQCRTFLAFISYFTDVLHRWANGRLLRHMWPEHGQSQTGWSGWNHDKKTSKIQDNSSDSATVDVGRVCLPPRRP